ncbi:transcription repressor OFP7-like [Aristolochia californica]|uniref:transcription repressor OFP7-like n=1 Tax=Aristolochia californica TaxID=171875 RepID=UPI0035E38DB6
MAKRLKQKISKVFPSFQSCRSKGPSSLPENPVPVSVFCLSTANPKAMETVFPVAANSRRSFRKLSTAVVSIGGGSRSTRPSRRGALADDERSANEGSEYRCNREEKWHVVEPRRKIDYTDNDDKTEWSIEEEISRRRRKKTKPRRRKKSSRVRTRFCTSSADSGWFSSEERDASGGERRNLDDYDDETETLFSTDSSQDYNPVLKPIREAQLAQKGKPITRVKMGRRRSGGRSKLATPTWPASPDTDAPGRCSVFRCWIPCSMDGKVKESFAVVKRSEDPYEDFRRSMLEMILEKQMFNADDLVQLLPCFLSLNAEVHHGAIVEAFSDIWEIFFCKSPKLSVSGAC